MNYIINNELILSEGLTIESLFRGFVGIITILSIAFLFSSNKKNSLENSFLCSSKSNFIGDFNP